MSNSKEEGEIEEGELPGEFSSHPEEAPKQEEPTALDDERPPNSLVKSEPSSSSLAPYGIYTQYIDGYEQRGSSSRYHSGYRERSSGGQQWSRYADYGDRGRGDSYREASDDDLLHDFAKLIAHTGITDAIKNLDEVCKRLESAMEILNRLWKRSERSGRDGVFSSYATQVASLHKALRAVQVASGTGAGKTQNMDKAKSAMKYAWHLRERLFSAAHQKELENWISSSKYFRFILAEEGEERAARSNGTAQGREDRETGEIRRASADREASAGRGSRHPDAGGASSGQEGDRSGGWQNGKRLRQDSDLSEPSDSEQQHKQPRHSDRNNQSSRPQPAANGGSAAATNGNDSGTDDVAVMNDQSPPPSPPSLQLEAELASLLQTDARDLLKQGKLCLVLDLDHTLLNSARFSELSSSTELSLQNRLAHETQSIPAGQRELYRLPKVGMWTKLRPGVREFLQRASEKFELWIHTNGNRQYASAVIEVLDPSKEYFGSRVITGAGSDHMGASALMTKRLMQGLEGREPVVIIVDDSSAVWPHDLRNLLVVERYLYFPPSAPRGTASNSLFELSRDECPHSGMLKTATRVIETVHAGVFRHLTSAPTPPPSPPPPTPQWDVREVLAAEKRKILAGCTIVFTRVIPLNTDPQSNSFWKLAESYGAVCSLQLNDATTHVIAATAGTEKANQARAMGKQVVNLSWLNASCILWQRADEALFTLQD